MNASHCVHVQYIRVDIDSNWIVSRLSQVEEHHPGHISISAQVVNDWLVSVSQMVSPVRILTVEVASHFTPPPDH